MNALAPPGQKEESAPAKRRSKKPPLHTCYHFPLLLQAFAGRARVRHCVACDSPVRNKNLGGSDGRSALTGPLWCYDCADYPRQLLLALGKAAR